MKDMPEITPIRETHRFDESKLAVYLQSHLPGFSGALLVRQFEGGQSNPTFHLSAGGQTYVMRKKPPGALLKSAHQVEREYKVMSALADTDVVVPQMYLLCEDRDVIGTEFYVMEMVAGRVIPDVKLPNLTPRERAALYEHFAKVLADLHTVDYREVGLAEGFGRPGNYFERQISRWCKQYIASQTEEVETMEKLMEWLPQNIPASDEVVIVHGDYRIGNSIIHPTEPRMVALLDWELSTLGHPLGDLAYSCMSYYSDLDEDDLPAGIPGEQEFVERYCEYSGCGKIENWHFYIAYNLFRSAAIVQGVYKRGLDGNASSKLALTMGDLCKERATRGWRVVEKNN